jgi:hypothetical protein
MCSARWTRGGASTKSTWPPRHVLNPQGSGHIYRDQRVSQDTFAASEGGRFFTRRRRLEPGGFHRRSHPGHVLLEQHLLLAVEDITGVVGLRNRSRSKAKRA